MQVVKLYDPSRTFIGTIAIGGPQYDVLVLDAARVFVREDQADGPLGDCFYERCPAFGASFDIEGASYDDA